VFTGFYTPPGIAANNLKVALRVFYNIMRASYYYNPYVVVQHWPNANIELGGDFLGSIR
jgi:hypothetical protein